MQSSQPRLTPYPYPKKMLQPKPVLRSSLYFLAFMLAWTSQSLAQPKPFEDEIAAFEARRQESPPPDGAILCIGSSSMRMWNNRIEADLAPLTLVKLGFGGSKFRDAIAYFDELVGVYSPRAILLYEGDNDIDSGMSPADVTRDFQKFVTLVHDKDPKIRIYVISIKPSTTRSSTLAQAKEANAKMAEICQSDPRLIYIDVMNPLLGPKGEIPPRYFLKDCIHMNDTGYEIWARTIRNVIVPLEQEHER